MQNGRISDFLPGSVSELQRNQASEFKSTRYTIPANFRALGRLEWISSPGPNDKGARRAANPSPGNYLLTTPPASPSLPVKRRRWRKRKKAINESARNTTQARRTVNEHSCSGPLIKQTPCNRGHWQTSFRELGLGNGTDSPGTRPKLSRRARAGIIEGDQRNLGEGDSEKLRRSEIVRRKDTLRRRKEDGGRWKARVLGVSRPCWLGTWLGKRECNGGKFKLDDCCGPSEHTATCQLYHSPWVRVAGSESLWPSTPEPQFRFTPEVHEQHMVALLVNSLKENRKLGGPRQGGAIDGLRTHPPRFYLLTTPEDNHRTVKETLSARLSRPAARPQASSVVLRGPTQSRGTAFHCMTQRAGFIESLSGVRYLVNGEVSDGGMSGHERQDVPDGGGRKNCRTAALLPQQLPHWTAWCRTDVTLPQCHAFGCSCGSLHKGSTKLKPAIRGPSLWCPFFKRLGTTKQDLFQSTKVTRLSSKEAKRCLHWMVVRRNEGSLFLLSPDVRPKVRYTPLLSGGLAAVDPHHSQLLHGTQGSYLSHATLSYTLSRS
ncbi:hypothetical protein FB45DRAFT_862782 [Roridomyces roridus]|uniref:Uncharacterized protein n=1 Tax=Roridomyces roridus TaxID=1738132 RepID=A0AAD7C8B9_9AGAR|nr:hypothetical protein FB45DRAFT_862782 [Roridomyces roridus]